MSLKWSSFTSGEAKLGLSDSSLMQLIIYVFLQAAIKTIRTEMKFISQLIFEKNPNLLVSAETVLTLDCVSLSVKHPI